jgi:hypothetical protein
LSGSLVAGTPYADNYREVIDARLQQALNGVPIEVQPATSAP